MTGAGSKPRLAFLGLGWIGTHRLRSVAEGGLADIVGLADTMTDNTEAARSLAPHAAVGTSLEHLLALKPDGIVIATPSALHAEQSISALRGGAAVFCQKPLGRNAAEAAAVVGAAQAADRLLMVDLSYRYTHAMQRIRDLVRAGELGRIFAMDLAFHNAYGPDKAWFYDSARSGGGCVMDLGTHLIDLALWLLDVREPTKVTAKLWAKGAARHDGDVEDYATMLLEFADDIAVTIACSWNLHAGRDAVISAEVHGTQGGAAMRNVDGSFLDFTGERFRGTASDVLASPPDDWGGGAISHWTRRLAAGERFGAEADDYVGLSRIIDAVYAAS